MRLKGFLSGATLILALIVSGVSWAQCPEDTIDLGICDTLYVEPWAYMDTCFIAGSDTICVNNPGEEFPSFLFVSLFVTHDSNSFYWAEHVPPLWIQDSIALFVLPLTFWHDSEADGKVIFPTSNQFNNSKQDPGHVLFPKSMFRHIEDENGDTIYNRLALMGGPPEYLSAWDVTLDKDTLASVGDSGRVFISLIPQASDCRRWWEGSRVLLATLTFIVSDVMHVYIDSAFWSPGSHLEFSRYDAINYVPRHNLPLTIWLGPPRIEVTSPNGGESWIIGETYDITWISEKFTDNVTIEYSIDEGGEWDTVIANTENDGLHSWIIPDTPSDSCRVRVSDAADGDPYDISDSNFSITYQPDFTIDAIPDTQWVKQGDTTGFEVILTSLHGFSSPCTLTVEGLPPLTTGEFDPTVIVPTDTSTLTITVDTLTPLGIYPLTITGTEMTKQIEQSIERWLVVVSALNFKPTISVPESVLVYGGYTANFTVVATDPDTSDTLTITKEGVGEFPCPPKISPNVCYFWWTTEEEDTLNSPYQVIFAVDDGRDSTDTGIVWVTVRGYDVPPSGIEGDANGDSIVNIADVVFLINYLFKQDPPPNPPSAGDINGDCFIGVTDIVWLINYLYRGGPPPQIRCLPGDVNYDGNVNLSDVFHFIDYILFNGPLPVSMRSTDVNADCFINVVDLVFLINNLLRGGSPPQPGCVEPKAGPPETAPSSAIAEVGFSELRYDRESRIMELPVYANLTVPVAAVALSVTWDPEELSFLEPILSSRGEGLGLYYNLKPGQLTVGMVDMYGKNMIKPGTGPIMTLRFVPEDRKKVDLKKIQIEKATFVNTQAQELRLKMAE